jgi:predicted tellurium resistance membrane protein TerC
MKKLIISTLLTAAIAVPVALLVSDLPLITYAAIGFLVGVGVTITVDSASPRRS